jgi:hypothetical protein
MPKDECPVCGLPETEEHTECEAAQQVEPYLPLEFLATLEVQSNRVSAGRCIKCGSPSPDAVLCAACATETWQMRMSLAAEDLTKWIDEQRSGG